MTDRAEGTIADAGEAVQRQVNRVDDTVDQVTSFIRTQPVTSVLLGVVIGYLVGKAAR